MPPKKSLADTIRDALANCGKSRKEIAKATGVDEPQLSRFLNGCDLRLETATRLTDYLGLHLVANRGR